jgi:hypothetical protein
MSLELLAKQQPSVVTALYKYKHEIFKEGALTVKEKELRESMMVAMYLAGPTSMVFSETIDKVLKGDKGAKG